MVLLADRSSVPLLAQTGDPIISTSPVRLVEGNSGTSEVRIPVYLSGASTTPVTVQWTTADGTASAPSDYTAASGTLTFAPGETFQTISLQIMGDTTREYDEFLTVDFSNASGASLGDPEAMVRIFEDETPTVTGLDSTLNLFENQNADFPGLSVGNPQPGQTLQLSLTGGTATVGTDLSLTETNLVADTATVPLPITLTDDALPEADETFFLELENPGPGVRLLPNVLIQSLPSNTPSAAMALQDDLLAAADAAELKIYRRSDGAWSLEQTITAGAENGVSSLALDQETIAAHFRSGEVKIFTRSGGTWSAEKTISLPPAPAGVFRPLVLQDDVLAIGDPAPAGQSAQSGKIRIHERHLGGRCAWGERQTLSPAAVQPDFGSSLSMWGGHLAAGAPDAYSVSFFKRGGGSRQWTPVREFVRFIANFGKACAVDGNVLVIAPLPELLTSRRMDPGGDTWSDLVVQNVGVGSNDPQVSLGGGLLCAKFWENGVRYFYPTGTTGGWTNMGRSLPSLLGTPQTPRRFAWDGKSVVLHGDGDAGGTPLLVYGNGPMPGRIIDDETVKFTVDDLAAVSGDNVATVRLSRPLPGWVQVNYTLVDGSAVADGDYQANSGTIWFAPGVTTSSFSLYANTPTAGEGTEKFYIHLEPGWVGMAGPDATVTIAAESPLPVLSMVTSYLRVLEGNSGSKNVAIDWQLSAPAPAGAAFTWNTVTDAQSDTAVAGSDFTAASGVVQVPLGATSGRFEVSILGDTIGEWEERFFVMLSDPVELFFSGSQNHTVVYISNDDMGTPVNDTYTIPQGGVLSGVDVRSNDTRIQEVDTEVTDAGRTLLYSGLLTYTPPPNFIGQYSFEYRDRYLVPDVPAKFARVTVTVTDAHLPPVVSADNFSIREDTVLDLTADGKSSLLTNDGVLNAEGVAYDPIMEISVTDVVNGTVTNSTSVDGRVIFTPAPEFSGDAGFRYRLRDKDGWSNFAQVTVRVSDDLPMGPMQRLNPSGSQLFRGISGTVNFPGVGVVDYPLALKAGETFSLRVGGSSSLLGRLELRDASGKVVPGGIPGSNSLENIPITSDGVYKISAGDRGSNGSGTLTVLVNGGLPQSPSNAGRAYPLDSTRPSGSARAAVSSTLTEGTQYYSFAGVAGETVQLFLQSSALLNFTLQQFPGIILASSTVSPLDPRACLLRFTLPSSGTFLVAVKPATSGTIDFTLQLYRGAEIYDFAEPTPLMLSSRGSGYLAGRGVPENRPPEPMITFAAFGSYGSGSPTAAAVATMVRSWNPDFILAVGDHNLATDYAVGSSTWSTTVGGLYGRFIKGRADNRYREQTSSIQRYFTVPGNNDSGPGPADGGELASYLDYFHSNPGGNPRLPAGVHQPQLSYYKMSWGNADFYMLDSDNAVTDPIVRATERQWLKDQIRTSTAKWKFGVWHHSPFSSCDVHGNTQQMQWGADFEGLTAIITGHDHTYERLDIGYGVTQFVAGLGGSSFYSFSPNPVPGSLARFNTNHGALKIMAGTQGVQFEFRAIGQTGGTLIDSSSIGTPPGPVSAAGSDIWPLRVQPGQILKLSTRTPQPPGALTNKIDPLIQLLDASGAVVASDANSAQDGINASLTYTVPAIPDAPPEGALWSVRVANESPASGEYELSVGPPLANPYADWAAANLPSLPAGAQDDPDRDGAPNLMEFLAGTDPRAPGSLPPLTPVVSPGAGQQIRLNLPTEWSLPVAAGLQSSPSLAEGSWTTLAIKNPGSAWTSTGGGNVPLAAPDGGFVFTLPSGPRQFYRLIFSSL